MADATTIAGVGTWLNKGVHQTKWNLGVNTTGDVGSVQGAYGSLGILSIQLSGTLASVGVVVLEQRNSATTAWSTAKTVCGTDISFDSSTGSGLSTGSVYMVRPGAAFFRPHVTAGASDTLDVDVVFVQSKG